MVSKGLRERLNLGPRLAWLIVALGVMLLGLQFAQLDVEAQGPFAAQVQSAFRAYGFTSPGVFAGTSVSATGAVTAAFLNTGASSIIASGATIAPTGSVHHISGVAAITTITVPAGCTPTCTITLIPDGLFTTATGGNISLGTTVVVNKSLILTWDGTKWNPSY